MTSIRVRSTAQKLKFSIKDFFNECDQILHFLCSIGNFIELSFIDPKKSEYQDSRKTCGRRNKVTSHSGFLTVKWAYSVNKEVIRHLSILHCGKFFVGCRICGLCFIILKLYWVMKLANQVLSITYFSQIILFILFIKRFSCVFYTEAPVCRCFSK